MPYADAMNKTLVFAIFDFDRFSKHDQIGEVKVPLCQVDLAQTIEEWRELQGVEGEGGQVSSNAVSGILTSPFSLLYRIIKSRYEQLFRYLFSWNRCSTFRCSVLVFRVWGLPLF